MAETRTLGRKGIPHECARPLQWPVPKIVFGGRPMRAVNEGEVEYKRLAEYFAMRKRELSGMVEPYIDVTDAYGALICSLVLTLGEKSPDDTQDEVCRDLLADVFDFMYDARRAILESQFSVAFPLLRR